MPLSPKNCRTTSETLPYNKFFTNTLISVLSCKHFKVSRNRYNSARHHTQIDPNVIKISLTQHLQRRRACSAPYFEGPGKHIVHMDDTLPSVFRAGSLFSSRQRSRFPPRTLFCSSNSQPMQSEPGRQRNSTNAIAYVHREPVIFQQH